MNDLYKVFEKLTWVGQLGFSLLFPPVCLLAGCWWLTARRGVGMWVYLPGLVLGLALGFGCFAQFLRYCLREQDKEREQNGPPRSGFNTH